MLNLARRVGIALVIPALLLISSCKSSSSSRGLAKPPAPPSNVQVSVGAESAIVSWDPVPTATHYTVFWGKDPTDYRNLQDSKACSLALAGLKTGDLYSAAVSAWNEHGESDYREGPYFVNDYDPSQAPRYISLGADFMERGLHVEAHAYFSSAVRLTPDDPAAYKGRAGLYTKINRPDLAQADLQTAERLLNKTTASDGKAKPWEAAAGR